MNDNRIGVNTSLSNTNSNSNQIVNLNYLDREASLYKSSKTILKENSEIIQKTIEKNTEKEIKDVQTAINNLNKKVERIVQTDFVKDKQQKIETAQQQMMKSIEEASKTFFKVRDVIRSKENLSDEDKHTYEEQLFHKIIDKFMTQEEKNLFLRFVNRNPLMLLGDM